MYVNIRGKNRERTRDCSVSERLAGVPPAQAPAAASSARARYVRGCRIEQQLSCLILSCYLDQRRRGAPDRARLL